MTMPLITSPDDLRHEAEVNLTTILQHAEENCSQAKNFSKEDTLVFVGMEHVLFLNENIQNPIIIIEPSSVLANYWRGKLSTPTGNHIQFIVGGHGVRLAQQKIPDFFNEDDCYDLAIQFYKKLPDNNRKVHLFFNTIKENTDPITVFLKNSLLLCIDARNYHYSLKGHYNKQGMNEPSKPCCFISSESDLESLLSFKKIKELQPLTLNLTEGFEYQPANNKKYLSNESDYFVKKTDFFSNYCKTNNIGSIFVKNRIPFNTLGDILFLNEFINKSGIKLESFYVDYFKQQTGILNEASRFYYPYYSFLGSKEIIHIFERHEPIFSVPPNKKLKYIASPFLYHIEASSDKNRRHGYSFERDIAIIHHARFGFMDNSSLNDFFQLSLQIPGVRPETSTFVFLEHLRDILSIQSSKILSSNLIKNLLNFFDFNFYALIRNTLITQYVDKLSSKYKVTVFGDHWNKIFPEHLTHGHLNSTELPLVYQNSYVTLDFTPIYFNNSITIHSMCCLNAGGFPIRLRPIFDYPSLNDASQFIGDLPSFDSIKSIENQIDELKKNPQDRANKITTLNRLFSNHGTPPYIPQQEYELSFDPFLRKSLMERITLPEWISTAATGYLFSFLGYEKTAIDLWISALEKNRYQYAPLVSTTLESLKSIGAKEDVKQLLAQAIKFQPTNEKYHLLQTQVIRGAHA